MSAVIGLPRIILESLRKALRYYMLEVGENDRCACGSVSERSVSSAISNQIGNNTSMT